MNPEIKVTIKTVYGRDLIYPACPIAEKFASLLNVKTFNIPQLKGIEAIGFTILNTTNGIEYFNIVNSK